MGNAMANLTRREADIVIRPTPEPPEFLVGRRLTEISHAVYGSRTYFSRHRRKPSIADEWIGLDDTLAATVIGRWMRDNVPEPELACRVDTLPALRDAALAGLGLALLPCYVGDIAAGLRRATRRMSLPRSALWLLTHDDLKRVGRVRATMDFLAAAFASERPLFEGKAYSP
jgi:DNA-binding transcriptional LysR family regulator